MPVPETEGCFVVNVADARWIRNERGGDWCLFERREARFPEFGVNIRLLRPGQALYHSENTQEDFLVLSGECICLIEGEERRLKAWDFVLSRRPRATPSWEPARDRARS